MKSTQKQYEGAKKKKLKGKSSCITLKFINKNTKIVKLKNTSVKMWLPWQHQV